MMISENWASLKREASTLETYVEQRLQAREPPAPPAPGAAGGAPGDVEQGAAADPRLVRLREIEESLGKLAAVVERLSALATASGSSPNLSIAQVRVGPAARMPWPRALFPLPSPLSHPAIPPCTPSASATCWARCSRSTAASPPRCASG